MSMDFRMISNALVGQADGGKEDDRQEILELIGEGASQASFEDAYETALYGDLAILYPRSFRGRTSPISSTRISRRTYWGP